jgi:hypothetical protein
MLLSYLLDKIVLIIELTLDAGPMIHVLPQLWQKNLPRPVAKKLDSCTAQSQSYTQQCNRAGP